jgi:outer membrane biosynthesis protein TonB
MDSAYSRLARPVLGRSPLRFRRFWLKGTIPTLVFLLSLGAHGLLLKLPMPPQAETPPPEPEEPALSVVTLPQPTPISRPPALPAAATPTPDAPQPPDATPTPAEPPAPNLDLTEPQPSTAPQQVSPAPATPVSANGSAAPETPPVVEFPHPENFRAVDCGGNYDCRAVTIPEQSDNLLDWMRTSKRPCAIGNMRSDPYKTNMTIQETESMNSLPLMAAHNTLCSVSISIR